MTDEYLNIVLTLGPVALTAIASIAATYIATRWQAKKNEEEKEQIRSDAAQKAAEQADVARMHREERLQQQLERRTVEQDRMIREQGEMIELSHVHTMELREQIFALKIVASRLANALKQCLGEEGIPQDLRDALDGAGIKGH